MTKFTPGKWKIGFDDFGNFRILGDDNVRVCDIGRWSKDEGAQADARLIASAPEMYELLQDVVDGRHSRALVVATKVLLNRIDGVEEDVKLPEGALLWFEHFPCEFCERCYGVHTDPLDGLRFCSVCQFNIDDPKCYRHEENAELVERLRRDDRILSMRTGFRTHVF